jgi:hypothetical protein
MNISAMTWPTSIDSFKDKFEKSFEKFVRELENIFFSDGTAKVYKSFGYEKRLCEVLNKIVLCYDKFRYETSSKIRFKGLLRLVDCSLRFKELTRLSIDYLTSDIENDADVKSLEDLKKPLLEWKSSLAYFKDKGFLNEVFETTRNYLDKIEVYVNNRLLKLSLHSPVEGPPLQSPQFVIEIEDLALWNQVLIMKRWLRIIQYLEELFPKPVKEVLDSDDWFFQFFRRLRDTDMDYLLNELSFLIKEIENQNILNLPIFHGLINEMEFFHYKDLLFCYENFLKREFVFRFDYEGLYKGEDLSDLSVQNEKKIFNWIKEIHRFINTYKVEEEEELGEDTQAIIDGKLKGLALFLNNKIMVNQNLYLKSQSLLNLILLKEGSNILETSAEVKKNLLYKVEAHCLKWELDYLTELIYKTPINQWNYVFKQLYFKNLLAYNRLVDLAIVNLETSPTTTVGNIW